MTTGEKAAIITEVLTVRELLEGVAEEAAELSQAALKVIRATRMNNNATPVDAGSAWDALHKEWGDLQLYLHLLTDWLTDAQLETYAERIDRWYDRLVASGIIEEDEL